MKTDCLSVVWKWPLLGLKKIGTHVNNTCKRFLNFIPGHHGPLLFLWNPVAVMELLGKHLYLSFSLKLIVNNYSCNFIILYAYHKAQLCMIKKLCIFLLCLNALLFCHFFVDGFCTKETTSLCRKLWSEWCCSYHIQDSCCPNWESETSCTKSRWNAQGRATWYAL